MVRMRTAFENGVLRNGQQPASAVNNFIDQDEFGALKTLSGHIACGIRPRDLGLSNKYCGLSAASRHKLASTSRHYSLLTAILT